jgi:hypothetical protein
MSSITTEMVMRRKTISGIFRDVVHATGVPGRFRADHHQDTPVLGAEEECQSSFIIVQ